MVTLYTTNCPKCKVLEAKLKQKNIDFAVCDDEDEMIKRGFQSAPVLDCGGEIKRFPEAMAWVDEQ